ncbi:MAG: sigma-70 family RNA polymerase sigma factor [Eubacteriales bacterium]|nr:sigma-70 family RNA polymerase sigma factor [Eubacteriales bacterium]
MVFAEKENADSVIRALEKHSDMVRRISFMYLRNKDDVEDVFQEVFLKLLLKKPDFESDEHEKAWLIRVTINKCKDLTSSFWSRNVDTLEGREIVFEDKAESVLMEAVVNLPKKYKDVIYLFYYEGYSAGDIAKMLNRKENTVYSDLHRARNILRDKLGESADDYTF